MESYGNLGRIQKGNTSFSQKAEEVYKTCSVCILWQAPLADLTDTADGVRLPGNRLRGGLQSSFAGEVRRVVATSA